MAQVGYAGAVGAAGAVAGTRKPLVSYQIAGRKARRGRGGGGRGKAQGGLTEADARTSEAKAGKAEAERTLKDFEVDAKRREDEIDTILQPGKEDQASAEQTRAANELLMDQYGDIYNAYNTLGGESAAALLNKIKANDVKDAFDVIKYTGEDGDERLKFVDRAGRTVNSSQGPVDLSLRAIEGIANRGEQGDYKATTKGELIYNTKTGEIASRSSGVAGGQQPWTVEKAQKEVRTQIYKNVGGFNFQDSPEQRRSRSAKTKYANQLLGRQAQRGAPMDPSATVSQVEQFYRSDEEIESEARKEYEQEASAFRSDKSQFGRSEKQEIAYRVRQKKAEMERNIMGDRSAGIAASQQQYREGQTATGQNGERMIFLNGDWVAQ